MNFATGALWVVTDKVIKVFGALLVGVMVTRYLGPTDLGILNYGLLTLTVCMGFIPSGLKYYALKELGANTDEGKRHFQLVTAQLLLFTALGFLSGMGMLWFFAPQGGFLAGFMVLASALSYPLFAMKYQMESVGDFKRLVIMDNTGFVVSSLAKAAVMVFDWGLLAMAITYVLEVVVVACLLWWVLVRKKRFTLYREALAMLPTKDLIQHVKVTLPLLMTAFIQSLYLKVDQLIVASYLSPHELGLYATSMRMADIAAVFPIIVTTALYPMLARLYAWPDRTAFVATYRGMLSALVFGALAFIAIIQVFSLEITTLLFGKSFAESAGPLRLLVLSTLTTYMGYMWHAWMVLENQGALLFRSSVISVVLSFAGSMWLVPRYGIEGAAFSTAVAFILSALYAFSLHAPKVFFGHVLHAATHPVGNLKGLYVAVRRPVQAPTDQ